MGFSFETPILSSFYFSKFVNSRDRDTNVKFQSAGQTSGNRHRQDLLNPKKQNKYGFLRQVAHARDYFKVLQRDA